MSWGVETEIKHDETSYMMKTMISISFCQFHVIFVGDRKGVETANNVGKGDDTS